jgi:hypothetical protein
MTATFSSSPTCDGVIQRLLRARRQRPRYRRAEQRDELTPFQLIELHSIPPG